MQYEKVFFLSMSNFKDLINNAFLKWYGFINELSVNIQLICPIKIQFITYMSLRDTHCI